VLGTAVGDREALVLARESEFDASARLNNVMDATRLAAAVVDMSSATPGRWATSWRGRRRPARGWFGPADRGRGPGGARSPGPSASRIFVRGVVDNAEGRNVITGCRRGGPPCGAHLCGAGTRRAAVREADVEQRFRTAQTILERHRLQ